MFPATHLNECLKRFIPACTKKYSSKDLSAALLQPYLTYTSPENDNGFGKEEASAVGLVDVDGLIRTPFSRFRFCVESFKGVQMLGFVERKLGALALIAFHRTKELGLGSTFFAATFTRADPFADNIEYDGRIWDSKTLEDISEEMKYSHSFAEKNGELIAGFAGKSTPETRNAWMARVKSEVGLQERRISQLHEAIDCLNNGIGVLPVEDDILPNGQADMFMAYYRVASLICYEYLAPQNFVARVTPNTPGKSVEWRQAREHMTLIHRHHPANSEEVKAGAVVAADSKHLTRIAHSRRAHTRLLRSDKFKFKKGQRVAVRASWCGPKQWQDTAGQTYEILIPAA